MTGADVLNAARKVARAEQSLEAARLFANDPAPFEADVDAAMRDFHVTFARAVNAQAMVEVGRRSACAGQ